MPKIERKPLTTPRQHELLRILEQAFDTYEERYHGRNYYSICGMSTDAILRHVMQQPITALTIFWPKHLVKDNGYGSRTFILEDDAMTKAMSAVRDTLHQLAEKGHIKQRGNEWEVRWSLIYESKPEPETVDDLLKLDNPTPAQWEKLRELLKAS